MTITAEQAAKLLDECDWDDCLTCEYARALIASEAARKLAEERLARAVEGLRLIELIGYREGEAIGWINAHMRGVATDTLSDKSLDHYWRFFPAHRHRPNLAILKEIDNG